jgi:hypothetical protein
MGVQVVFGYDMALLSCLQFSPPHQNRDNELVKANTLYGGTWERVMREQAREILPHVSPCEPPLWACAPPLLQPTWPQPVSCALTELDPNGIKTAGTR